MIRLYGIRHLRDNQIRLLTAAELARFFDNRDPRDWTDPVPVRAAP